MNTSMSSLRRKGVLRVVGDFLCTTILIIGGAAIVISVIAVTAVVFATVLVGAGMGMSMPPPSFAVGADGVSTINGLHLSNLGLVVIVFVATVLLGAAMVALWKSRPSSNRCVER